MSYLQAVEKAQQDRERLMDELRAECETLRRERDDLLLAIRVYCHEVIAIVDGDESEGEAERKYLAALGGLREAVKGVRDIDPADAGEGE